MSDIPAAIPVLVLSGFLGSGKTTLLNRLIRHETFANAAVIINEFGEIGLDHHLVESADDTIIELSNGCLCCTVRGKLVETLEDLIPRKPERIVIETTGLADPVPILQALTGTPTLKGNIRFSGLCTVFDTLHGKERIKDNREAVLQISLADHLILTKLDCFRQEERMKRQEQCIEFLRTLNAECTIVTSDEILEAPEILFAPSFTRDVRRLPEQNDGHSGHHHDISIHNDRISALTLSHDKAISMHQMTMFLDLLLSAHSTHILRLKGLANIEGETRPVVIQAVGGTLSDIDYLDSWPDKPETRLVVFLDGMDRQFVQKLFDGFMNIPATDTPDRSALEANPLAIPGAGTSDFS